MNKESIGTLIHYNYWANERILDMSERLTREQLTATLTPDPGWGSLRGILVHILDVEYGWRTTLQSLPDDGVMNPQDFADVNAIRRRWLTEKDAWMSYLDSLDDDILIGRHGDDRNAGPLVWQTIMHVMLHSGQHRAEAAYILTGCGHSPGELDFAMYMKQHRD